MTVLDNARMRGIGARAKALILHPRSEWELIATEVATVRSLYVGYVVILAAIPAVAGLVGDLVFGFGGFGHIYHISIIGIVVAAIIGYALNLGAVYVMGLIIEAAAPYFGGTKDRMQAMKVAAFFPTASWLAGIFRLIPQLAPLQILGLYSLFILWLGLPKLMNVAEDKALLYTVTVIVVAIVVTTVISVAVGMATTSMM